MNKFNKFANDLSTDPQNLNTGQNAISYDESQKILAFAQGLEEEYGVAPGTITRVIEEQTPEKLSSSDKEFFANLLPLLAHKSKTTTDSLLKMLASSQLSVRHATVMIAFFTALSCSSGGGGTPDGSTEIDTTPPALVNQPEAAENMSTNPVFKFIFTEPIADVKAHVLIDGKPLDTDKDISIEGLDTKSITLKFNEALPYSSKGIIELEVKDAAGNVGDASCDFSVKAEPASEISDTTAPELVSDNFDVLVNLPSTFTPQLTFNESVLDNGSQLTVNGTPILTSVTITDKTVSIAPTSNFPNGADVTVDVRVRDRAGNSTEFSKNFSIESVDNTPPTLVSSNINNNETGISVNVSPQFTFNEALSRNVTADILVDGTKLSNSDIDINIDDKTITFDLKNPLAYNANVTIDATAGDDAGNLVNFSRQFRTEAATDTLAPTFTVLPTDGSTVSSDASFSITFSEPVSTDSGSFVLTDGGTNTSINSPTWSTDKTVATVTPRNSLTAGSNIGLTISDFQDLAGNTITNTDLSYSVESAVDLLKPKAPKVTVSTTDRTISWEQEKSPTGEPYSYEAKGRANRWMNIDDNMNSFSVAPYNSIPANLFHFRVKEKKGQWLAGDSTTNTEAIEREPVVFTFDATGTDCNSTFCGVAFDDKNIRDDYTKSTLEFDATSGSITFSGLPNEGVGGTFILSRLGGNGSFWNHSPSVGNVNTISRTFYNGKNNIDFIDVTTSVSAGGKYAFRIGWDEAPPSGYKVTAATLNAK